MIETTAQFNKLFIIQSLSDTELQTGDRLAKDALRPKLDSLGLGLVHFKVANRAQFFAALDDIWKECAETRPRIYPILHLDTHGRADKSGIAMLPSDDTVTWVEFVNKCQAINVECHNNLVVTSGLCFGLLAITAINFRAAAPFLALVGPQERVTAGEIDDGFPAFYGELLGSGDIAAAHAKLSPKFALFLSDRLFLHAFATFLQQSCKGVGRAERIERLLAEFLERDAAQKIDETTARRIIEDYTMPNANAFERFKRVFLVSDHPLNVGRFDGVSFETALAAAERGA